ncbi:UNVERIFIED_ORG: two-component system chemotaxis response regulator CheB [Pseudomonas fluorescens]|uniref:chemotaxis protein CheB n=1 Tax=Pseudomonas TaxID=286 RepID=UPI0007DDF2D6|nr:MULTISPECIES: chemotaxis protein CheB [Pseudomonas]ANI54598.1 chemotaxis protein CheB [Pseudomonas sp. DR 5-09]MDP9709106.1 two-component system chemotaxis response regulator CheB [Pseudomonas fluorescens]QZD68507.1 chemotaxis protein CheB [Pseudomonas sp. 3-2]
MNSAADLPRVEAIVVGASAGGVEALLTLLGSLRAGFGLPIIIVLHLPEERRSQLVEVFARRLALPVAEAIDKQDIMPGTVYFATPGYHLSVEQDRSLSLSLEDRLHHSRPSIDFLFESAADAYGPALAAVLLTGANHDGARGLAQVKRRGGLTVVQDPDDAQVDTMPRAALKTHQPDYILPIHGIGRLLVELERIAC